ITLTNPVINIGTTRVYELVLSAFCEAEVVCDKTYFLNSPDFPVYIDFARSGFGNVACALCQIDDPHEVITPSNTDFATITIVAGAIGEGSIAVHDALYTYPPGTRAGFVIHDINNFAQVDLF